MKKAGAYVGASWPRRRRRPPCAGKTVYERPLRDQEQLGGYYMISAGSDAPPPRCPGAQFGAIEVRPIWPGM
jgi:hypothetical protein